MGGDDAQTNFNAKNRGWNVRRTRDGVEFLFGEMRQWSQKALGVEFVRGRGLLKTFSVFVRVRQLSAPDRVLASFGVSSLNGDLKFFFRRKRGIRN